MLGIDNYSNAHNIAAGRQNICAMAIIGWLLGHHTVVQAKRASGIQSTRHTDILCRPCPLDALLALTRPEIGLAGQLMAQLLSRIHRKIVLVSAGGQSGAPAQRGQSGSGAALVDGLKNALRNLLLSRCLA